MMRILIPTVLALVLGAGGAAADPVPAGTAAPSAPDMPAQRDKGQPPVTEQQDMQPVPPPAAAPPAAAQGEPAPAPKPDTEKPAADASPKVPEEQTEAQKAEEQKAGAAKNVEPVAPSQAFSILGKKVRGPDGKDTYGAIIDLLVDDQGQPRAAIIDFGGFLGVGSRKIAVDWQLLKFQPTDQAVPIVLDLDRKQIQSAPEYKDPNQPAEVVEPALVEIQPLAPVPETVATPGPSTGAVAPADSPPPVPQAPPPGSVAAPALPSPDAAAPADADKHAN
jgi:hypothetical protein